MDHPRRSSGGVFVKQINLTILKKVYTSITYDVLIIIQALQNLLPNWAI